MVFMHVSYFVSSVIYLFSYIVKHLCIFSTVLTFVRMPMRVVGNMGNRRVIAPKLVYTYISKLLFD